MTWLEIKEPKENLVASQIYNGDKNDRYKYAGNWRDGKPNGEGVMVMRDGRKFKAHFINGFYTGKVELEWENGNVFEGFLLNNKLHGEGRELSNGQPIYVGQYEHDQKHGVGV